MNVAQSLLSIEERRTRHYPLFVHVDVSGPGFSGVAAELIDLCKHLCPVRIVLEVKIGALLTINVPGFTTFAGWVAWTNRQEVGIDFAHAPPEPVVAHLTGLGTAARSR